MKITSGEYSGVPLFTPKNYDVRPTLSKIRQAVFNMLRPGLPGSICVDTFSGTGAFGFEALSNGAAKAVMIDLETRDLILRNAAKLKVPKEKYELLSCDFELAFERLAKRGFKADYVFADPPYNRGFNIKLLKNRSLSDILNEGAVFVLESHKDEMTETAAALDGWNVFKEKKYGNAFMLLMKKTVSPEKTTEPKEI
jgi:16S rRNA (guanine966-N2)-methyltransferase